MHIPSKADTHIQKIAPGPPIAIAPDTPAILPVPMEAASAVHIALNGDTAPSAFPFFSNALPRVFFMICKKWRNCGKPQRILKYTPTPRINTIIGSPQTKPLIVELILVTKSTIKFPPRKNKKNTLIVNVFHWYCNSFYGSLRPFRCSTISGNSIPCEAFTRTVSPFFRRDFAISKKSAFVAK